MHVQLVVWTCLVVAAAQCSYGMIPKQESNAVSDRRAESTLKEYAEDPLELCQAIEAGLSAMRDELCLYSRFELRSEWRDVPVVTIEDLGAFAVGNGPEMEAADGVLFCLDGAVGIHFKLQSQLDPDGGYYSYSMFERGRRAFKFIPAQQYTNGDRHVQQANVWKRPPERSFFFNSNPGLFFCPWVAMGLGNALGLTERIQSNLYTASVAEEFDQLADQRLVVIKLARRGAAGEEASYRFDLSGRFPILHEFSASSTRVRLSQFVELEDGIVFPALTTVCRGPFHLGEPKRDLYDVKIWRMFDLGVRAATPEDFKVEFAKPIKIGGESTPVPAGEFDVWKYLEQIPTPEPAESLISDWEARIHAADEEWQARHSMRQDGNVSWRLIVIVLFLGTTAFGTVQWLRHGMTRDPTLDACESASGS